MTRRGSGAPHSPRRGAASSAPVSFVTLALLFAMPVFFVPGHLAEEFEFTKVMVLVTGALVLLARWVAAESSRITSAGFLSWLRVLPRRIAGAIRHDPLGGAGAPVLPF